MVDSYISERDIINVLLRTLEDEKRARESGKTDVALKEKGSIASLLGSLAARGYCRMTVAPA